MIDRLVWPWVRYQSLVLMYQARRTHRREVPASSAGRIALSIGEGHGVYPSIGAGISGHRGYEQDELGQSNKSRNLRTCCTLVVSEHDNGYGYGYGYGYGNGYVG
jgi:hypothetical protein